MLSFKEFLIEIQNIHISETENFELSKLYESNLSLAQLRKREGRIEILLNKLSKNDSFETSKGDYTASVLLQFHDKKLIHSYHPVNKTDFVNAAEALNNSNDTFLIASVEDSILEKGITFSQLIKTREFGGKGAGGSLVAEDRSLIQLRKNIDEAIKENEGPISIQLKNTIVQNIVDVEKTKGTPKSDFQLIDADGKPVVWISHKDGKTPRDFQQWGGISQKKEPKIFNHKETQKFIDDLKREFPEGLPKATTVYRHIKDHMLKMISVYGNEFGGKLGEQNVSILLQGPIQLKKNGSFYELTANSVHYNGDSVDADGFEPVLMAIYKGDRSDAGVKGTRIVISPIAGRKSTSF